MSNNEPRGAFRLTDAVRPHASAPAPIDLTIVPVARLKQRGERFRCEQYACVLSAGACADRQARLVQISGRHDAKTRFVRCHGCAVGARVVKRVGPGVERTLAGNAEQKHTGRPARAA